MEVRVGAGGVPADDHIATDPHVQLGNENRVGEVAEVADGDDRILAERELHAVHRATAATTSAPTRVLWNRLNARSPVTTVSSPSSTFDGKSPSATFPRNRILRCRTSRNRRGDLGLAGRVDVHQLRGKAQRVEIDLIDIAMSADRCAFPA